MALGVNYRRVVLEASLIPLMASAVPCTCDICTVCNQIAVATVALPWSPLCSATTAVLPSLILRVRTLDRARGGMAGHCSLRLGVEHIACFLLLSPRDSGDWKSTPAWDWNDSVATQSTYLAFPWHRGWPCRMPCGNLPTITRGC